MKPHPLAAAMAEAELERQVRAIASGLGLMVFHVWGPHTRRACPGFPDFVLAGPGGVLFRELKTERGKVTPAQQAWLDVLTAGGGDAKVWRPGCLLSGEIAGEMAGAAGVRVPAPRGGGR
jgi:hypothetical protein